CSADQQGEFDSFPFHFFSNVNHLFQRRRNESRKANDVRFVFFSSLQNFFTGNHHPKVNHFEVITTKNNPDNVLSDVVHIPFYCRQNNGATCCLHGIGFSRCQCSGFLCLHEWLKIGHRLFHHASRLHHLWQEHFPCTKQISHHAHSCHQWSLNDIQWPG